MVLLSDWREQVLGYLRVEAFLHPFFFHGRDTIHFTSSYLLPDIRNQQRIFDNVHTKPRILLNVLLEILLPEQPHRAHDTANDHHLSGMSLHSSYARRARSELNCDMI